MNWVKVLALFAIAIAGMAATPESENRRAGAKLFARNCSACHGEGARGTSFAPRLAGGWVQRSPPEAIAQILKDGRIFKGMPSFAHIPEPERFQIVMFLQSLGDRKADGKL